MKTATVEDLCQRFGDVEKWIEAGEEVTVTRQGVAVATLTPPKPDDPALPESEEIPVKADWERRFRERPPVKPKKPLTAEETAAFHQALKRDF